MTPIKDVFFAALPAAGKILDVGAGNAPHARMLHEKGYAVVATDKKSRPEDLPPEIEWLEFDLTGPLPELPAQEFDGVLIRNVIQFLEREQFVNKLLPWALDRLKRGGILCIETFWDRMRQAVGYTGPEESRKPHPSYYTADDLKGLLSGMEIIWSDQFRHDAKDMENKLKNFAVAQIVAKKI